MKKQIYFFSLIFIIFSILFISCKKDIMWYLENSDQANTSTVQIAKIFHQKGATLNQSNYNKMFKSDISAKRSSNSSDKIFYKLQPIWKETTVLSGTGNLDFIVVPTKENKLKNKSYEVHRYFIFIKKDTKIIGGEIVEFLHKSDYDFKKNMKSIIKNYQKNEIGDFSGSILGYDLNYFPLYGFVVESGRKTNKFSKFSNLDQISQSKGSMTLNSSNGRSSCQELYWCTGYYGCSSCEQCDFLGYSEGCYSSGGGSSGYDSSPNNGGGGGGSYGGNQPPLPPKKDIKNLTNDPCISNAVEYVLHPTNGSMGGMDVISQIIRNFDQSKYATITISDGYTQNGTPAEAIYTSMSNNIFTARILLQTSYFTGTTKEAVASSLIHEFVHAYLGFTGNQTLNVDQHNVIADKYVEPIATYLKNAFNLPIKDAYALAWSGLGDSKVLTEASDGTPFLMSNGDTITKNEISTLAAPYNDSERAYQKGTYICQN